MTAALLQGGGFYMSGALSGQYWGNKNKKPSTTRVKSYYMETAGVLYITYILIAKSSKALIRQRLRQLVKSV